MFHAVADLMGFIHRIAVLVIQGLQALGARDVHPAELGLPVICSAAA
jgi:hypothetical protein